MTDINSGVIVKYIDQKLAPIISQIENLKQENEALRSRLDAVTLERDRRR